MRYWVGEGRGGGEKRRNRVLLRRWYFDGHPLEREMGEMGRGRGAPKVFLLLPSLLFALPFSFSVSPSGREAMEFLLSCCVCVTVSRIRQTFGIWNKDSAEISEDANNLANPSRHPLPPSRKVARRQLLPRWEMIFMALARIFPPLLFLLSSVSAVAQSGSSVRLCSHHNGKRKRKRK